MRPLAINAFRASITAILQVQSRLCEFLRKSSAYSPTNQFNMRRKFRTFAGINVARLARRSPVFRSLGSNRSHSSGDSLLIGTLDQRYREATIVGAGIAGMLAGYRVTLLEQKQRGGGLIKTIRTEHGIAESAAHSLITTDAVRELCRDLCVELIEPARNLGPNSSFVMAIWCGSLSI